MVEDNDLIRAGLVTVLASDPEIDVIGQATTGPDGVRLSRHRSPDLVLMDVEMPGGDGITGYLRAERVQ